MLGGTVKSPKQSTAQIHKDGHGVTCVARVPNVKSIC